MPDAVSLAPEALALKRRGRRRLIGAVTIALLLVVFVPMILDSEPRKAGKDIALTIPAKDGQPALPAPSVAPAVPPAAVKAEPKPVPAEPVPVEPKPAEQKPMEPKPVAESPPAAKVEVKPEPKVEPKLDPKPEPKLEAKPPAKPEAKADPKKLEGFVVQLGAFSDADKVKQLVAKLKAAKIPVFTEQIKGDGGNLTRVRVGPYKTREQADKALPQIKKAGGENGKVVPLS